MKRKLVLPAWLADIRLPFPGAAWDGGVSNWVKNAAVLLVILSAVPAMAETLTWVGSSGADGSKWFTSSTANWTNSAGSAAKWSDGNDAYFDDGSDYRDVEIASAVSPANVTFDISRDMVLTNKSANGYISLSATLTKDGPGTLWINPINGTGANRINISTNTVHVRGGTLKVSSPNANLALGDPAQGWRAYVHGGGKLWIAERNALANGTASYVNQNNVGITVYTNGVLSFKNGEMNNQNINNVRTLDLVGGTMELPDIGNHSSGFLRVLERFSFGKNPTQTPYVFDPIVPEAITQPIAGKQNRLQLGTNTEFRVADITGDDAPDVTFNSPVVAVKAWETALGPCGFRKTGPGKMVIAAPFIYDTEVDRPNGPITIEEGELEYTQPYALEPYTNTVVRISTNATLTVNGNMFVNIDSTTKGDETALETNKVPRPIVVDHGTLNLKGAVGHYAFGDLTLDHAQISFAEVTGSSSYGVLSLLGKLTLKGDVPISLTPETFPTAKANGGTSYEWTKVLLCKELTEFCVDDITGDTNVDFTVSCVLQNQRTRPDSYWADSGFVKTGPGTMVVSNASTLFTGNLDVREGVLSVGVPIGYNADCSSMPGRSLLGGFSESLADTRRIVASGTGTLWLPNRSAMIYGTSLKSITNTPASFGDKYAYTYFLIKDGGTLRCTQHQHFDRIEFSGGKLRGWGGNSGYGIFQVLRLFKVSGNTAFSDGGDIVDPDDPYDRAPGNHAIIINGVPTVEFNIADVTGDGSDDATFCRPIAINYFYKKAFWVDKTCGEWGFGLRKTGAGTMRLAAIKTPSGPTASGSGDSVWPLNGTISVEEGELKVDGDQHELNLVDVASGAYLSGTGIVNNVTLAAGAGFKVSASATDALQINGDCSFGSIGRVVITNPEGIPEEEASVILAKIEGEVSGADNLHNWVVNFNGVDRPASLWKISVRDGVLTAKYSRGTVILVK